MHKHTFTEQVTELKFLKALMALGMMSLDDPLYEDVLWQDDDLVHSSSWWGIQVW